MENPQSSDTAFLQNLVKNKADLHKTTENSGETALHLASRFKRALAADILLDAGAIVSKKDINGRAPLHTAIAADAKDVTACLLRKGNANVNARTNSGETSLITAARLNKNELIMDLILHGANLNAVDKQGSDRILILLFCFREIFTVTTLASAPLRVSAPLSVLTPSR